VIELSVAPSGRAAMLRILTCAVAAATARRNGARSTKGGQNVRKQRRSSLVAIENAYNLSKASAGREAIDEAVMFVANEERAGMTLGARAADVVAGLLRAKQTAPGADEVAPLLQPGREDCVITKKMLREDGVYLYRGDDAVVACAEIKIYLFAFSHHPHGIRRAPSERVADSRFPEMR